MSARIRISLLSILLVLALAALGFRLRWFDGLALLGAKADPPAPTVVFVVLDTVRADHLSLCGYARPTSPTLEELRDRGAAVSCRAYAPGTWTLPSHASYFTGELPPVHGAHFVTTGEPATEDEDGAHLMRVRGLGPQLPTLAERMAERGYQTVAVSSIPVVSPASGLTRGFEHLRIGRYGGELIDAALWREVRHMLAWKVEPERPLFLFVNIADAHDPYPAHSGLDWLPDRPAFDYGDESEPWQQWVTGRMPPAEREAMRAHVTDVYDHGIRRADANLARVLKLIERTGWDAAGLRVVITSDHGEFLGEHDLMYHGRYLYEPDVRVPVLYFDSAAEPSQLPEPMAAIAVHDLVLSGELGPSRLPVSVGYPDEASWMLLTDGELGASRSAAVWVGRDKLRWMDGELHRFDVVADPLEARPLDPGEGPARREVERLAAEVLRTTGARAQEDAALRDMLEAVGYVE